MRKRVSAGLVLVAALMLAWELAVGVSGTPVYLVPAPSDVAAVLGDDAAALGSASLITLLEAVSGLLIGAAVGVTLAILVTFWGHFEQGVMSLAILVKSTPIIAVAPILTIWLGFGIGPKVIITALLTFFPVLVNSLEGFRSVDPAISDWAHSIDASPREMFVSVRWPSARPFLFAALKVAAPLAMIGAVVAEWIGASSGLGRHMWVSYTNLDMPSLFAAVLAVTLLSTALFRSVLVVERRTVHWAWQATERRRGV
jgi:NitT/TauT family transport system permease protein